MINALVQRLRLGLLTNWHVARWIRLGLGIVVGLQALFTTDVVLAAVAALFLFQVVTNTGCCVGTCAVQMKTGTPANDASRRGTKT